MTTVVYYYQLSEAVAISGSRNVFTSSDYGQNWVSKPNLDICWQEMSIDSTGQYVETASRHMMKKIVYHSSSRLFGIRRYDG